MLKILNPIQQVAINTGRLFKFAWQMDRRLTVLYYLTAAIGALAPLGASYVLKLLIDHMQTAQQSISPTIPVVIVVILAARYVVTFLDSIVYRGINQSYIDYLLRYKLQNEISLTFQKKISQLDIAYFEDSQTQDLISKLRSTMLWKLPDFLRSFSEFFRDSIAYLAAFLILLPYGWWMPVIITIATLPRLYLQGKYGVIQWSLWGSGAPQVKKLYYLHELLQDPQAVRETRIAQSSGRLLQKFKQTQDYLLNINKRALDKYIRASSIPPILETVLIFFIAYQFIDPVLAGALSIGTFTLIVTMLEQLGSRAAGASARFANIYESNLYVNDYFHFLSLPQLLPMAENPTILTEVKPPRIEFKNVSFRYPGGPEVLSNVSFTLEPGESVALVGHNGAGKTTIIKLLCRFYDVTEGEILINGVNIKQLELASWYRFLGTLFQEFVKYHFTVRENIALGAPDRKDERAMKLAAEKSGAAEFIEQLPNQYDQVLGKEFEDGEELSGGQWQKLAIARAFYEDPPVLIMDEPTSAVDAEAEYEIFNNLEKQYRDKMLILVSHRFSTVRNASKIIVIDHGRIVESGSHEQLINQAGIYAKLFSLQAKGYR